MNFFCQILVFPGKTINRVINENWQLIYNEIGSSFEQAYAEVIKQHTRSLFLHVPIDDFLPERVKIS